MTVRFHAAVIAHEDVEMRCTWYYR